MVPAPHASGYGTAFWLAYGCSFVFSVAVAILIRYGDFITLLGGTEFHLGWIVGFGMIGSLLMRVAMGMGIDRYGARAVWLLAIVLFVAVAFAHLAISSHQGMPIYLLRIGYCSAVAGFYGAGITFVANRAPVPRMAEVVGIIGTAGFLGSTVGSWLGDLIRGTGELHRGQLDAMFVLAGILAILAIPLAWLATRGERRIASAGSPPVVRLIRQCNPGLLLLIVTIVMGAGLSLPPTFLPTYAADRGIARIGLFFTVYCVVAVATRVSTRSWPERLGLQRMVILGLVGLAVSQLLFLGVRQEWQMVLPGIGYGMSHAILFPATIAIGNRRFPEQHRGLGTVLMLTMWDVGQLLGMPVAGAIVHYSDLWNLPAYSTMFAVMAVITAFAGGSYALGARTLQPAAVEVEPVGSHRQRKTHRARPRSAANRR